MYYIAGVTEDGMEMGCDFGFDMIERIVLDDILMQMPEKQIRGLVKAKRFSYFGNEPDFSLSGLVGKKAGCLRHKYRVTVSREHYLATVVKRTELLATLRRALIKIANLPRWQGVRETRQPDLFAGVVVHNPHLLRSMLSREKYGEWDHAKDRKRAFGVLYKFINFLHERSDLRDIILYSELDCPHWEASGEMHFNSGGELLAFKYFGPGNGQLYKYYPRVGARQRS